jgi:hypothetical protein
MASLTSPVAGTNLVLRFNDFVAATANAGVVWGTDVRPFAEFTSGNMPAPYSNTEPFGGVKAGMGTLTGNQGLTTTTEIDSVNLYDKFVAFTANYTRIKRLNAQLYVRSSGGSPWNTGSRGGPGGTVTNVSNVAHMNASFAQSAGTVSGNVDPGDIRGGEVITKQGIDGSFPSPSTGNYQGQTLYGFFKSCKDAYVLARADEIAIQVSVCHASCHSSCHSSRIRR